MTGTPPPTVPAEAAARTRSRHVHELDVVRVLTFACVIAVHTVSHANPPGSVAANAALMLLHFTREAFFFLTGFVLVHQYIRREVRLRSFYGKRFSTVAVPYLVWTVIYTYLPQHWRLHGASLPTLLQNIAYGTACYHLYFLLVSLQIYLLYPLLARLIRDTAGHHGRLLLASAVLQVALMTWLMYAAPRTGWLAAFLTHEDAIVVSYQFYVILGAVAAYHANEVRSWIAEHSGLVAVGIVPAAIAALAWYFLAELNGTKPDAAAAVLQPVMVLWSVAAIAGLFAIGSAWNRRRVGGSLMDRALSYGSDRSFGVFLVHPAILGYVLDLGWVRGLPAVPQTLVAYLGTVVGSLLVVEVFRRCPFSKPLTGRAPIRRASKISTAARRGAHNNSMSAAQPRPQSPGEVRTWTRSGPPDPVGESGAERKGNDHAFDVAGTSRARE